MPDFHIREEGLPTMEELFAQLNQNPESPAPAVTVTTSPARQRAPEGQAQQSMDRAVVPYQTHGQAQGPPQRHAAANRPTPQPQVQPFVQPKQQQQQPASRANYTLTGLKLLVSEELVEQCSWLAAELNQRFGLICLDAPLQEPLSLIVDNATAVCIMTIPTVLDRAALKLIVKKLTGLVFKFKLIWLVVTATDKEHYQRDNGEAYYAAMVGLFQALARFPIKVCVRET